MARVYPIGAISVGQKGETLAEFGEMISAGAVAVSDDGKPVANGDQFGLGRVTAPGDSNARAGAR